MSNARAKTRDLLLEYNHNIIPPRPRAAGLGAIYAWGSTPIANTETGIPVDPNQNYISTVYPWENTSLIILFQQLYKLAIMYGFAGSENEFKNKFTSFVSEKEIIFDTYNNFPQVGAETLLYFDLNERILYYWNNEYIPVNAMLITNTIINGGGA